jgi:hypothetical protein
MGLLKSLFGRQSKSRTSESSILSTILRIENQNSLDSGKTVILEECAALLLNTTDHPFFEDIDSSLENSAKNLVSLKSKLSGSKSEAFNSCWILFENTFKDKMVNDINSFSTHMADLGLADNMTAAIFKSVIGDQITYWICNYRTSKFYPMVPIDNGGRDNDLELEFGEMSASLGIPTEPHENWYSLSDIPF